MVLGCIAMLKPPQNNVMAISKALKAVNDTMD